MRPVKIAETDGVHEEGSGKKIKLYPFADLYDRPLFQKHMTPVGITLHYSAGASARSSISHMLKNELGYHLLIDRDGSVFQMYRLDSTCYHAGNARWNGISPNRYHLSIALCSFGPLEHAENDPDSFENVFGQPVSNVVHRNGGYWEPASHDQEDALMDMVIWLCTNLGIAPSDICGHQECCIPEGRKIDPGGVLGYSLEKFRGMVKALL